MKIPTPNEPEQQRSHALSTLIHKKIQQDGGSISFAQYMESALYYPELGFYTSPRPKFGKLGDFITAPELSPLFAKSIARQCHPILKSLNGGDILELGAGSGKLAMEILLELNQLNQLPKTYYIFEKSPALRLQQQLFLKEHCAYFMPRIVWLDTLKNKIKGIVLANEVLDALPVHCFRIEKDGMVERCVAFEQGQFVWKLTASTTPSLIRHVTLIQQECKMDNGYESEINLNLDHWITSIANILEKGVILLFDYGYGRREYYHPDRTQGTLMCFYQHHRYDDPFPWVGLQDITAHVDFTAVLESAISAGLNLGGYTTQSSFLLACGLLDLAQQNLLMTADNYQQNQAIKKLTFPSQMGELIKVMALTKHYKETLLGFSLYDRKRNL
jgi:SAM-dependent MidA family methyltransferase